MARWHHNPEGRSEVGEYRDAIPEMIPRGATTSETPAGGTAGLGVRGQFRGRGRGRGAGLNPGNRFETVRLHVLGEHLDEIARDPDGTPTQIKTQVFPDRTRRIINKVQWSGVGFDWTLNPYRGCEHGCVYCYARPYHEYLGFSSGIDFETKIMAKHDAPRRLEEELADPKWRPETIVMSAITDCWQPIEQELGIARACLEILARCRQPVSIITRNKRVLRDVELIAGLARLGAAEAAVSLTSLDNRLSSAMEPRASSPADRLATIRELSAAGVPVTVMIAPVIPGLTDREIPRLLEAAADAGAASAGLCMLRLPYQNKALFLDWLGRKFPDRAGHVEALLRQVYDGKLYDADLPARRRGKGQVAEQIARVFRVFRKRCGLDRALAPLSGAHFQRPAPGGQMTLFA